jgi:hypothetical protein
MVADADLPRAQAILAEGLKALPASQDDA